MGKKGRNVLILVLILAILIALYAVTAMKKKSDEGSSSSAVSAEGSASTLSEEDKKIVSFSEDEVNTVSFETASLSAIAVKDGESWSLKDDSSFPLDGDKISDIISAVLGADKSNKVIDNGEMETYGLAKPYATVTLSCATAGSVTLNIGDENPTADGTYFSINDETTIYLGGTSLRSPFEISESDLIAKLATPSITTDYITDLLIEKKDGNIELSYEPDNDIDTTGSDPWILKQGYDRIMAADQDKVTSLLGNYGSFTLGDCVTWKATDSEKDKYGLDNPSSKLTVSYYEDETGYNSTDAAIKRKELKTFSISFGNENSLGSSYYCQIEGDNGIYEMSADAVSKLVDVNRVDVVNSLVELINIKDVSSMDVTCGGKAYKLSIKEVASGSSVDDGTSSSSITSDDETVTKYFWDGKEVDKSTFTDIYSKIIGITIDREADRSSEKYKGTDEVLTVSFKLKNGSASKVTYYGYDDNFCRADVDGESYFLANRKTVESTVKAITEEGNNVSK